MLRTSVAVLEAELSGLAGVTSKLILPAVDVAVVAGVDG